MPFSLGRILEYFCRFSPVKLTEILLKSPVVLYGGISVTETQLRHPAVFPFKERAKLASSLETPADRHNTHPDLQPSTAILGPVSSDGRLPSFICYANPLRCRDRTCNAFRYRLRCNAFRYRLTIEIHHAQTQTRSLQDPTPEQPPQDGQ